MTPATITQPPRHITGLEELPFLPWLDDAACLGEDPELWFAEYGRNEEARAICLVCGAGLLPGEWLTFYGCCWCFTGRDMLIPWGHS